MIFLSFLLFLFATKQKKNKLSKTFFSISQRRSKIYFKNDFETLAIQSNYCHLTLIKQLVGAFFSSHARARLSYHLRRCRRFAAGDQLKHFARLTITYAVDA